jgi:hypothetical protein
MYNHIDSNMKKNQQTNKTSKIKTTTKTKKAYQNTTPRTRVGDI